MAEQWTKKRYPQYAEQIAKLAEEHAALKDEPLLLAISYGDSSQGNSIHIFELVENFGHGEVNPDKFLFEAEFGSSSDFPLNTGDFLHLVLSNPQEMRIAIREEWPPVKQICDAISAGNYEVLHGPIGEGVSILEELQNAPV